MNKKPKVFCLEGITAAIHGKGNDALFEQIEKIIEAVNDDLEYEGSKFRIELVRESDDVVPCNDDKCRFYVSADTD